MFWIIEGKLAGRAGPVVEPWNLMAMKMGGVTAIVSTDEDCHAESIREAGLKHIKHFMPSSYPTSPALVDRFAGLVEEAVENTVEEVKAGGRVVVHCYAGRDRSGLVLCGSLIALEGVAAPQALARVRQARPQALTGPGVMDVLREVEVRLATLFGRTPT